MAGAYSEPRQLILSWTPGQNREQQLVSRFKTIASGVIGRRNMTVIDVHEPGADRAEIRARCDGCTDFVSVVTYDYATAVRDEFDELEWAWPMLRDRVARAQFWAIRLSGEVSELYVTLGGAEQQPWRESAAWHFLPPRDDPSLSVDDEVIRTQCVEPIKNHGSGCATCGIGRRVEAEAGSHWWRALVGRVFGGRRK